MTTKYLLSENDVRMYLAVMGKIPKNIFERTKDIFKSMYIVYMYVIVDLKIKKNTSICSKWHYTIILDKTISWNIGTG